MTTITKPIRIARTYLLPVVLLAMLEARAAANHRSINSELITILEEALKAGKS